MPEKLLLKPAEVAAALNISEATLRNWRLQGLVEFTRIAKSSFVSKKELERLIKEHTIPRKKKEKDKK